jgi:hypothetical protein
LFLGKFYWLQLSWNFTWVFLICCLSHNLLVLSSYLLLLLVFSSSSCLNNFTTSMAPTFTCYWQHKHLNFLNSKCVFLTTHCTKQWVAYKCPKCNVSETNIVSLPKLPPPLRFSISS